MGYTELPYTLRPLHGTIREDPTSSARMNRRTVASMLPTSIEEELYHLRLMMEKIYSGEKSFTAPNVVEASTKLDMKIIEYMTRNDPKVQT